MSRYHRSFKLHLAKLCQYQSSTNLSQEYGVTSRQIRYWSQVFRIHGENSFRHVNKPYSSSFKLQVLSKMLEQNWSLNHTSAFFDLSSAAILLQWKKVYDLGDASKLIPKKTYRPTMSTNPTSHKSADQMTEKEMREELEYLRAENAVLKKLKALAQAKQKLAKKKRSS